MPATARATSSGNFGEPGYNARVDAFGKLKRMYADLALENAAIKDVLKRKL